MEDPTFPLRQFSSAGQVRVTRSPHPQVSASSLWKPCTALLDLVSLYSSLLQQDHEEGTSWIYWLTPVTLVCHYVHFQIHQPVPNCYHSDFYLTTTQSLLCKQKTQSWQIALGTNLISASEIHRAC